jgi:phospholipase/carboxylesterase
MHKKEFIATGKSLDIASKVLIMVHGRGASAEDILGLADELNVDDFAVLAPEAPNHSWYPYSFLSIPSQNEPWLSASLEILNEIVTDLETRGKSKKDIYFLGFSQGACLMLEYAARNADRYGGLVSFTGGLIGDKIYKENYSGDFNGTPILLAGSDPDPHVPAERIQSSSKILLTMNANVVVNLYKDMGHTVSHSEIRVANELIFGQNE